MTIEQLQNIGIGCLVGISATVLFCCLDWFHRRWLKLDHRVLTLEAQMKRAQKHLSTIQPDWRDEELLTGLYDDQNRVQESSGVVPSARPPKWVRVRPD